ncbi:hypothetical protein G7Y89_g7036 [Cudoniella acicularis]|uniref:F-box domain-containing protein n=1 Tax=Cudoniella acicularis TaxID=354080 RepID=A0A8H4W2G2_9HELO|nr:hypothetical protein G7Y89_g7036 [Cudoniella acicularis]
MLVVTRKRKRELEAEERELERKQRRAAMARKRYYDIDSRVSWKVSTLIVGKIDVKDNSSEGFDGWRLELSRNEKWRLLVEYQHHQLTPPTLWTLPPELHLQIFKYLQDDILTATCLGLTCRKFYPIYRNLHSVPVELTSRILTGLQKCKGFRQTREHNLKLALQLIRGFRPVNFYYDIQVGKLVHREGGVKGEGDVGKDE